MAFIARKKRGILWSICTSYTVYVIRSIDGTDRVMYTKVIVVDWDIQMSSRTKFKTVQHLVLYYDPHN
jgi:hypothetical protein